jgi:hypothetical protein
MQCIYNYIPETTHVSRVESVAAILYLQFVVVVLVLVVVIIIIVVAAVIDIIVAIIIFFLFICSPLSVIR